MTYTYPEYRPCPQCGGQVRQTRDVENGIPTIVGRRCLSCKKAFTVEEWRR